MNFTERLKHIFKNGNIITKLIFVNVAVYLLVSVLSIFFKLFGLSQLEYTRWFSVPSNLQWLITHFWTPITYMFYHERFFHILFNMLVLFWFGRIFLLYYSEKQVLSLYFLGGLFGAVAYIVAYNLFPYYEAAS